MRHVKRIRRKFRDGGTVNLYVYPDGSARMRLDHPSNDPEIEMAMAGMAIKKARELGLKVGPVQWRDDP